MACEITKAYGLDLKYVDIGGGFFGGLPDKPQFSDYIEVISGELGETFNQADTVLIVEPGTSLVSSPFSFVTTVTDVKRVGEHIFVVTDGSRIYVDPLMKKTGYFFDVEYQQQINPRTLAELVLPKQIVCGFTCMEFDRLFVLKDYPQLSVGDRIIYWKIGAYTLCLSPLFIKNFPAVYVQNGKNFKCVRKPGTVQEFIEINNK
jgi:diaminopimelate decarboxylase